MANARLLVEVAASLGTFREDMGKAAAIAEANSKRIESAFAGAQAKIGTILGSIVGGLSVGVFVDWAKDIVASASALDDLADATGSSVESLSKLANQARISGVDFETLKGLTLKLSAGMAGADDESSNVGRALAALGVTARDPAEALQQVAVSLNKYADGIGKAALARDLFGKGGPAFLANLKDIAETQDVAATTTARQAAEAEQLEKALRRLGAEGTLFKNVVLSDIVPALNAAIEQMKEGIRITGSFGAALGTLGGINPFKSIHDNLADTNERIRALTSGDSTIETRWAKALGVSDEVLLRLKQRKEFLQFQERQQAMAGAAALGYTGDVRDYLAQKKPTLDYTGIKDKIGGGGRQQVDEFAKALEAVSKMAAIANVELGAAFSGEQMLPAQRALASLMADDVWKKFTANQQETIKFAYESVIATEKDTQALKDRRAETEKQIKTFADLQAAQERAREQITAAVGGYAEHNDVLQRELALVGADDLAHQKLAATIEYETLRKKALAAEDDLAVAALDAQYEKRIRLLESFDKANKQLDEQRRAKEFVDQLGGAFASAGEEALVMGKKASDVLKSLEQDLLRIITRRLVTEPLAAGISSMLGGLGVGNIGAGLLGSAAATVAPSLGASTLAIGMGFASGTDFAPGGWAMVGERGPELVNLPRGAQVVSNSELISRRAAKSISISQQINVLPGASRASATQASAAAARDARTAVIRNG